MPLTDKDIIQINATVIAGLLILITIQPFVSTIPQNSAILLPTNATKTINQSMHSFVSDLGGPKMLGAYTIWPFSFSAVLSLLNSLVPLNSDKDRWRYTVIRYFSIILTSMGFVYLMFVPLLIAMS